MNSPEETPQPSQQSAKPRWKRWLIEGLIVLLILAGVQVWQTRDVVKGTAPALSGRSLQGASLSLAEPGQSPTLVHFWADWCPICGLEEASIQSLSREYRVISVATTSGDAAHVRAHMAAEGLTFPVIMDEDGEIARRWGVRGVPASFIIDGQGKVAHALVGYTSELGFRVRLWLAGL